MSRAQLRQPVRGAANIHPLLGFACIAALAPLIMAAHAVMGIGSGLRTGVQDTAYAWARVHAKRSLKHWGHRS